MALGLVLAYFHANSGDANRSSSVVVWIIAAVVILAVIVAVRLIIRRLRK